MRIGLLRERVTLQVKTTATDVGPGKSVTWGPLATVWAHVQPLKSGEVIQAMAMGSAVSYTVRIRYRTDVTPANRLRWDRKTLQIHSVVRVDGKTEFLELLCGEIA